MSEARTIGDFLSGKYRMPNKPLFSLAYRESCVKEFIAANNDRFQRQRYQDLLAMIRVQSAKHEYRELTQSAVMEISELNESILNDWKAGWPGVPTGDSNYGLITSFHEGKIRIKFGKGISAIGAGKSHLDAIMSYPLAFGEFLEYMKTK